MGTDDLKVTPPDPSLNAWTKQASFYKHTGMAPEKDTRESYESRTKNRKKWRPSFHYNSLSDEIMAFNKLTTCHGPRHVLRNRGTCFGVLWALVTVLFFVLLVVINVEIITTFFQREVQSQTTMAMAGMRGLPLPSIILCNRGFFSKAKMREQGVNDETGSYIIVALLMQNLLNEEVFHSLEGMKMVERANWELFDILQRKHLTIEQLITKISYNCTELILQCSLAGVLVNATECCQQFQPVKTLSGLCFQRSSGPDDRQPVTGEYTGYSLYVRLRQDDLMRFEPKMIDVTKLVKAGMQLTVASNLSYPGFLVMGQGTILTPNELTSLRLSLTQVDRRNVKTYMDPFETPCVNAEDLDAKADINTYLSTSVSCIEGGYMKCYARMCDCYNYAYTSNSNARIKICTLNETITCNNHLLRELSKEFKVNLTVGQYDYNEDLLEKTRTCLDRASDECRLVCVELTYSHDSEVSPLRPELMRDLYRDFGLNESTTFVSVATVFYPSMRYGSIKEWRKNALDLISDLGGYMGLFLGCSLITCTELVIAVLHFIFGLLYYLQSSLRHRTSPVHTFHHHSISISVTPAHPR